VQSSSQIVPTNSQYFLQAVALPVAQPTVLEHLRKNFLSSTVITKFQQESLSGGIMYVQGGGKVCNFPLKLLFI